ncbi:uncharacterized protein LTR77_005994 [Saxophila tyrrhenica]|uniref:Mediator of RNA polymerase II transcription subunit 4 n=1 Tax=Saxophila tyrrhenica TaxID=1690608 RepID=A0AAV9PAX9_9PEZI|nr:hypothetical protein LTR77_005994 [Saxophila tyrrhenica]
MLSQFQASYQRVEQSLQRLTDSIASYNPSVRDADELVAADEAVNRDLDQLVTHQSNYLRIQQLRKATEENDERIRSTIKQLADARKELSSIPSSIPPDEPRQEIKVDELLAYAKFISPTTVPPTFRRKDVPILPSKKEPAQAQISNGIATPPAGAQENGNEPYTRIENVGTKAMSKEQKQMMQPELPWVPWPEPGVIASGALAEIQRMVESGRDPASVLTAEEQAERDRLKGEEEERERLAQEEAEKRRMSMFDTGAVRRQTFTDVFDPDNE